MTSTAIPNRRRRQMGMTLVELMLAMVMLAVGFAGGMTLLATAIAGNNRNKLDTTATLIAQSVLERILAAGASSTTPFTLTDCLGNNLVVNPTSAAGAGAGSPLNSGSITFQAVPAAGYGGTYTVCRAGGTTTTYDVQWNIQTLSTSGTLTYTKLVTIAARPQAAAKQNSKQILFFGLPISLRGIAGNSPN